MRRLGATVAVAMLLALTFAGPAEAGRPAPAPGPYITNITGTLRWWQDTETSTWYYLVDVSVTAVGLGMKPLYIACTKVGFDGEPASVVDGPQFQPASRPHVTVESTVYMTFIIPDGSSSLTLTSQLMRAGGRPGCCTAFGQLRTVDATLPSPPPAHDATPVIFNESYTAP